MVKRNETSVTVMVTTLEKTRRKRYLRGLARKKRELRAGREQKFAN
jgi:hypothetical protein